MIINEFDGVIDMMDGIDPAIVEAMVYHHDTSEPNE